MNKPFSDLAQAEAWVFDLQKYGIKFGLSSTIRLVERLGLPYQQGRYVHLAGTNGKGSVAAMLSAVLTRAGYPVGLFTSPHLVHFQERYRLNDRDISAGRLLDLINQVRAVIDASEPPTFFEFATAMAFLFFFQEKADPVILETGMGGRLDATNIVQPLVSVITNISMDHMEFLGHTLSAVAGEKAGIIKPGAPLVTGAEQKRVLNLFKQRCRELGSPMYVRGVDFHSRGGPGGQFSYEGLAWKLEHLLTNLPGRHQYRNAAVALAALEVLEGQGFTIPEAAIRAGLQQARWPGRLEQTAQDPRVILDGAHNPAAARVLAESLKRLRKNGRVIMVLGIMADKDFPAIIGRLLPQADMAIFTQPRYYRAAKPEVLAQKAQAYGIETLVEPRVADAVRRAQSLAGPQDRIVVTGSLYTVGEAKEYLEG
ncbi:MAG: folylpolyglutamate synthase/dihydrofolate synthase family protein [Deltaproteobacteria bacterium]|nr:folylpolyglutamate synthase/dihydrofolate synthase family protein [Deltaproteobacteria bacterium]